MKCKKELDIFELFYTLVGRYRSMLVYRDTTKSNIKCLQQDFVNEIFCL